MSEVVAIDHKTAKPFIEKWHYSNRCPTGSNTFFGWYIDGDLYAVADYGNNVNPYQESFLSKSTGYDICKGQMVELKRLCRVEPKKEKYPLTSFLARCHRMLRKNGIKFVVSFSDPHYGHSGGIYKAANFISLGKTNPERHVIDRDGVVRHRRYYYRYSRRNGVSVDQARKELGLTVIKTPPKDRWFIVIDKKA